MTVLGLAGHLGYETMSANDVSRTCGRLDALGVELRRRRVRLGRLNPLASSLESSFLLSQCPAHSLVCAAFSVLTVCQCRVELHESSSIMLRDLSLSLE